MGGLKSIAPDEVTHDSRKEVAEDSRLEICVTKFISHLAIMHYISIGMYIYLLIVSVSTVECRTLVNRQVRRPSGGYLKPECD